MKIKCYSVRLKSLASISAKAYKVTGIADAFKDEKFSKSWDIVPNENKI